MIQRTDIYTAINLLLKSRYPDYKTYGHEVIEGYKKPSFFVGLVPKNVSNESVRFKKYTYTINITYFQEVANEIDNLKKTDEMQELFGYHLKVGNEFLTITDFTYDFIGENTNILQLSFSMEYIEYNKKQQIVTANEIAINIEKR